VTRLAETGLELWSPIQKQWVKNRPEERIRLRLIEYFLYECGISRNYIATEVPLELQKATRGRADIVCFDSNHQPHCLIECKRPKVNLDEQVAQQIAQYNHRLDTPYLLISNGRVDLWYTQTESGIQYLNHLPDQYSGGIDFIRDFEYWVARGFIHPDTPKELKMPFMALFNELYQDPESPSIYVSFGPTREDLPLENYYHITRVQQHIRLAIGLNGKGKECTLNAVLSVHGQSVKLLTLNLLALANGDEKHAKLYTHKGVEEVHIPHLNPLLHKTIWQEPLKEYLLAEV